MEVLPGIVGTGLLPHHSKTGVGTTIIPEQLPDRNLVSWVYYTYPFNLTGQPAASICAGIASDGMPVGLQIVARRNMETDVIRAASAYERAQSKDYNVRHFNA